MRLIYFFLIILFFSGCANSQNKVEEFFQTDNATQIKRDYYEIVKLLSEYKTKLDKRNPQNYDKKFSHYMYDEFNNSTNNLFLKENGKYIDDYNDYLRISIDPQKIMNRNDYLILGLYKQIYKAYEIEEEIQISTLTYEIEKLKTLYYALSVINWKIKNKRDENDNYLFLTWQNNWQIELEKRIKNNETISWQLIQNLKYIKNQKETIFSSSNSSFEVLMKQMLYRVQNSLKIMGEEPLDVSLEVMKTLVFFI